MLRIRQTKSVRSTQRDELETDDTGNSELSRAATFREEVPLGYAGEEPLRSASENTSIDSADQGRNRPRDGRQQGSSSSRRDGGPSLAVPSAGVSHVGGLLPGEPRGVPSFESFKLGRSLAGGSLVGLEPNMFSPGFWGKVLPLAQRPVEVSDEDKGKILEEGRRLASKKVPHPKRWDWGEEEDGLSLKERKKAQKWTKDDAVVFPGLAGRVPTLAFIEHSWVLFLIGFFLVAIGGLSFSFSFWLTESWIPFAIASVLGARALVLAAHALYMWIPMEGSEFPLAISYPWLDACTACLITILHIQNLGAVHLCIGSWLLARGVWLEAMALVSNWSEDGREWWLALVSIWPAVLVGALLVASRPLVDPWYTTALVGTCCLIDGVPAWIAAASLRVQMLDGEGMLPEYARGFVKQSLASACFFHGVLRLSLIGLLSVGFYVARS